MKNKFLVSVSVLLLSAFMQLNAQDSVHVDLSKALEIALTENPTIKIANRDIQAKKYYKSEQIAALFPSVSLSGNFQSTIQKQKMVMEMGGQAMEIEVGTSYNYSTGASLSLPLVAAPTWYNLKLSQVDVELAVESARSSKLALVKEVKKAYFAMLLAKDSYRVLQLNYENVRLSAQNVYDQYEQGLASDFDKLRAEVQVKNQKPRLTSAENSLYLATMMLKVLIGVDVNEPIIFDGHLSDFENEMNQYQAIDPIAVSLANNSDLRQLDYGKKQLEITQKLIKASSCPTLALSGNFQYMTQANNMDFSTYNWFPYSVVGISLQVPIISWAATSYKLKQTKLSMQNLADQRDYLENNLRVSINSSIYNINNAIADLTSNKETVMQAERAYNIVQKQFELGLATWLDLNSAELALTQSRLLYHQSVYDFLVAKSEFDAVVGNE